MRVAALLLALNGADAAASVSTGYTGDSCYTLKAAYQNSSCCNSDLAQLTDYHVSPPPPTPMGRNLTNPCYNKKPTGAAWDNKNCSINGVIDAIEQSGTNVTVGYKGLKSTTHTPITSSYLNAGLCPVNVHWHLGAEHYSVGEYDEFGSGSVHAQGNLDSGTGYDYSRRKLAGSSVRNGFQCHHYDATDPKFTTPYEWKHCSDMNVGETYEIHWPHSAAGLCGTPNQYQTPFYDGVFCNDAAVGLVLAGTIATSAAIGVQGQVFTIVNDESYYYPDLMRGMIIDGAMGTDMAYYTGSTTGTSRDNSICSQYGPITWQVDRKCHMISASSFDKMCADMKTQRDDMTGDTHPHGARTLVSHQLAADNHQRQRN